MKRLKLTLMFSSFSILFLATQCDEKRNSPSTYEEQRAELNLYKEKIADLAATSVCNETTECQFVGFGSKPCGGPWSFLIYTSSIDVDQLLLWVEDYNQLEKVLNEEWGLVSDCSMSMPPNSIECIDNTCNPIF